MTKGTNDGIRCPYCGKTNRGVCGLDVRQLLQTHVAEFVAACASCKRTVYYWARPGITLEAEQEGKTR